MDVGRVLCLTATATPAVAADICTNFLIDPEKGVFRTPVYRPKYVERFVITAYLTQFLLSLSLKVAVANDLEEKLTRIVPLLQKRTGPAIVYVTLQKHAEDVAAMLRGRGLDALIYHAGLPSEKREEVQRRFMESDNEIVCATIAFGMGIDKGMSPPSDERKLALIGILSQYTTGMITTCWL